MRGIRSKRRGWRWAALGAFAALFLLLPFVSGRVGGELLELADIFYRAGALVFGGGHVVLPLLQAEWFPILDDAIEFLAGYGAVQAVPGPLFTFSTYLGAITNGASGALVATVAIFLPSLLLIWGVMPLWSRVRHRVGLQGAIRGINASVVGILAGRALRPDLDQRRLRSQDAALAPGTVWGARLLESATLGDRDRRSGSRRALLVTAPAPMS